MKKILLPCLGLMAAANLSGCGGTRENDPASLTQASLDLAIEQVVDNTIIPAANRFLVSSQGLNASLDSFCAAPDASGLADVQASWKTLATDWYGVLPFNFGPLNDDVVFPAYLFVDSYRLRGTDYTETVRSEIDSLLAADTALTTEYFDGKTFQYVGLLALEVALFETAASQNADVNAVVAEFVATPRKCELATGLAGLMEAKAQYIVDGWQTSYLEGADSYRTLFLAGEIDDGSTPLVVLITAFQEYLDYLNQRATVSNVARLSGNAWSQMAMSVDALDAMLGGSDSATVSLLGLMDNSGNTTNADTVRANIAAIRNAIADEDAVTFNSMAATLDGNLKREVPDSLDVSLGINFTDGD